MGGLGALILGVQIMTLHDREWIEDNIDPGILIDTLLDSGVCTYLDVLDALDEYLDGLDLSLLDSEE